MDLLTEIMNFVNENYLKLVIGLVLILMAIIGYYAEKTGFGNKLKKENKKDKENDVDIDNIGLNDFVDNNSMITNDNIANELVQNQSFDNENIIQQQNQNINEVVPVTAPEMNSAINQNQIQNNMSEQSEPIADNNDVQEIEIPVVQENINLENSVFPFQDSVDVNDNSTDINAEIINEDKVDTNLEEEFKKVLPEQESIDNDLMVDINNMEIAPLGTVDVSNNNIYAKLSSNIDLPEINEFENEADIWKF